MVILRWRDEPEAALERYEQALATWREQFGGHARGPARVIAGSSDLGGLVDERRPGARTTEHSTD